MILVFSQDAQNYTLIYVRVTEGLLAVWLFAANLHFERWRTFYLITWNEHVHILCVGKKKRKVKVHIYQSVFQGDTILLCPSTVNHKIFIECDEVILSFSFVWDEVFSLWKHVYSGIHFLSLQIQDQNTSLKLKTVLLFSGKNIKVEWAVCD